MVNRVKLNESEVQEKLKSHSGWHLEEGGKVISKTFGFENFREAFAFMTQCALVAEKLDHHPDWKNSYATVDVSLSTHSSGGLTELDFQLALEMDRAEAHYRI
ncbi:4a-hydroxytetrahydrobiopterin dehydratase [Rhizobium aquaticum]|uniref:Putative pterin-4-alpha-carbinolamine dehydratase n=1 Tax=Rhizobium aquaticum TaxID=1549636 RepID=A0ABV2J0X1_9HYPH